MLTRNTQINGRQMSVSIDDDHRLPVDERRRAIRADVQLTVEARLTDADRDAYIGQGG
jgi:hypothetical protein